MKAKLENIFDDIAETKHEIMCFTEVLNDYKEFCYLNDIRFDLLVWFLAMFTLWVKCARVSS